MTEYNFHFDFKYLDFYNNERKNALFYNTSIVKNKDNEYIYVVQRIEFNEKTDIIIPGNLLECKQMTNGDRPGINFMWNQWNKFSDVAKGYTDFYKGNHKNGNLERFSSFNNTDMMTGDFRITKLNNIIFIHDSSIQNHLYLQNNSIIKFFNFKNIDKKGKNRQILSMDKDHIMYLDWIYQQINTGSKSIEPIDEFDKLFGLYEPIYEKGGVLIKIGDFSNWNMFRDHWIRFDKFIIDGKGSHLTDKKEDIEIFGSNYGIIPLFSFSTPHINYQSKQYGNFLLGVGHIKIHSDDSKYKYTEGSNIQEFRKNLYHDMKEKYGNKYVKHFGSSSPPDCQGYIYMMYFYILYTMPGEGDLYNAMMISDAYLPISLDEHKKLFEYDNDYKFSLIFPMGLEKIDDKTIIITAGYGDFYSVALEFDLECVIAKCKHDIKNMDMSKYKYYILAQYNNKSYLSRSFKKINDKCMAE
ncbi:hypothetical protein Indivirus_3_59 [Indivirus ILV1]|uniref:Uncharacterized protein n=1 Tax=Indivirus ILV1 TaxID=1977633 RepID=A0A1V0SDK3_9VIRU|nr:hypothetical protein Indivirus_3_59 [Indivirus ILV1]